MISEASWDASEGELFRSRIGTARRVCVASRRYLRERGTPKMPADLRTHECVRYTLLAADATWSFEGMPVKVTGRVRRNSPKFVTAMVLSDRGIAMPPPFLFADALASGDLRQVLEH